MIQNPSDQIVRELRALLRAHYGERLRNVVLFGSRARNEFSEASDYDILVVLRGHIDPARERMDTRDIVYDLCWKYDAVIMCHFASESRYAEEQSPLMMNIRREGVLV